MKYAIYIGNSVYLYDDTNLLNYERVSSYSEACFIANGKWGIYKVRK